jgi:hypothetical protein
VKDSLNKRLEKLEAGLGASPKDSGQEEEEKRRHLQDWLEKCDRDFEKAVRHAVGTVDDGLVTREQLKGASPRNILATYVVLKSRGAPRAEEVKALHEEAMNHPRRRTAFEEVKQVVAARTGREVGTQPLSFFNRLNLEHAERLAEGQRWGGWREGSLQGNRRK